MTRWVLAAIALAAVAIAAAVRIGRARETDRAEEMKARLLKAAPAGTGGSVDFAAFRGLPPPVARYFKAALADGAALISSAKMQQSGVLRTNIERSAWSSFSASQWVAPRAVGFVWDARVEMPWRTHVRVLDSYMGGVGAGRVSVLSALGVAAQAGAPELNAGALHRYLAEAVWFPTALLPGSGVVWSAIDDHSALATLTDHGTTVSLQFRFDAAGDVTSIYTPARFGQFGGHYRQMAWEGHFSEYTLRAGMRVPGYGEVGWYDDHGTLQLVWKGRVLSAEYAFADERKPG